MKKKELRSVALCTEIMFAELDGAVVDRGDYVVVRTPSNPTFFWGNFIALHDAPSPSDLAPNGERELQFAKEFPDAHHRLFAWDDIDASWFDAAPFDALGFTRDDTLLRRIDDARKLPPPNDEWNIRETHTDEWPQVFELCWSAPVHIGSWPNTQGDRIYARLGFTQIEHTTSLLRRI